MAADRQSLEKTLHFLPEEPETKLALEWISRSGEVLSFAEQRMGLVQFRALAKVLTYDKSIGSLRLKQDQFGRS